MQDFSFVYEDDIARIICDDTDHIFSHCKECGNCKDLNVKIQNNQIKLHCLECNAKHD